jgi:glycerol kinase
VWKLTGGKVHATDPSNASHDAVQYSQRRLDDQLLSILKVPRGVAGGEGEQRGVWAGRAVGVWGSVADCGMAGDQQAALFWQTCFSRGLAKIPMARGVSCS